MNGRIDEHNIVGFKSCMTERKRNSDAAREWKLSLSLCQAVVGVERKMRRSVRIGVVAVEADTLPFHVCSGSTHFSLCLWTCVRWIIAKWIRLNSTMIIKGESTLRPATFQIWIGKNLFWIPGYMQVEQGCSCFRVKHTLANRAPISRL